ncbi:uncharacterized protein B0T23DRAFT_328631 [Neurospora hispaniola]|uniref:Major facilitator superfamily (MFS) profile domain-containing protein n=1 Tax=Neurospora hispaniola TaxID=588809 RepID=A0AAJ0MV50_9PEZI|nr:hypothetical protein B0T23DRAFT_328631 [Neurospora hispaniola]
MITFGPRYSFLLATDSASRLRRAGSDPPPANARKEEDARTLQQLTANARSTKLNHPGGIDKSDDLFGGINLSSSSSSSSTDMPGWRYAFALSKDAVKAATPPGTVVRLVEHTHNHNHTQPPQQIDYTQFPIPTSDPSDPLNWARWRKLSCLCSLCYYAFVCSFASASLAPALGVWNVSFPSDARGIEELSRLTFLNVLVLGLGNIFLVPLANAYGRRIVLVGSVLMLFVATACGTRDNGIQGKEGRRGMMYEGMLVIRIFQGLGSSVSETLGPVVVGEMFFVGERGRWMALYTASLAGGSAIGGICGGYISTRYGWFGILWVTAALTGVALLAMVFLVPETLFERGPPLCFPAIAAACRKERHRHRHGQHRNHHHDIAEEEKEIDGGADGDGQYRHSNRRSSVRRYYYQPTRTPYLSLGTLPSIRMTMPSRFITSVYTPLNINTNQPQYFRDYWDPRLGLTWYETASESEDEDESEEERFSMGGHGRESSLPTVLRPPPPTATAAAQGGRDVAAGGLLPSGGIAARRSTAQRPRYRLFPPSEVDMRPILCHEPAPPRRDTNDHLNHFFTHGGAFVPPFNNGGNSVFSSIPSSQDPSTTHYEPYTYLRSLRFFIFFPPRQRPPPPHTPFDLPFPESPPSTYQYSPHNFSPDPNLHPNPNPVFRPNPTILKPSFFHFDSPSSSSPTQILPFPFPGTTTPKSLWRHFLSPILTLRLPAVWIATLHSSLLIGSVSVLSTLGPSLLASSPYYWTPDHAGAVLFGGSVMGIMLGGLYVFVVGDEKMKGGVAGTSEGRARGEGGRGGGARGGGGSTRRGRGSSSRGRTGERGGRTGGKKIERIKSWGERLFGSGNNDYGYAEAESRLMVAMPGLVIATAGLLVWGFCGEYGPALDAAAASAGGNNSTSGGNGNVTVGVGPGLGSGNGGGGYGVNRYSWLGLMFAFGMVGFGMAGVPGVWFNYLIDSYANLASDCFVMICISRGLVPFVWTFFVSEWVSKQGYLIPFGGLTAILGVLSLLLIPVIWYGKRTRIATARFVVGNQ